MDSSTIAIIALVVSIMTLAGVGVVLVVTMSRRDLTSSDLGAAVSATWVQLRLGETIGRIETHASEIKSTHKTLEQMLRSPTGRGSFGEVSLEVLLSDQLPATYFGVRQKCFEGKIPDAHIKSTDGLICIDSKFPLENFAKMCECTDGPESQKSYLKQFLADAERHLKKIAEDYVRPDCGTTAFALAYIPSEAVYYVLSTQGYDLLRKHVAKGVQVVSPLLLGHRLEILKLGIRALRLNENASEVLTALQKIGRRFDGIHEAWRTFHGTHLRHLETKANEIDEAYKKLQTEFQRIATDMTPDRASEEPSRSLE
jgi:DNA recombination protein RmuC